METNRPYDGPPVHLMKKAGFTMGYAPKEIIDVSGDWGHGWIVDGRFVGEKSPCLTCGYEIYCQNVDDRCSKNTFDQWTPRPTPGEFSREISATMPEQMVTESPKTARLNKAKRPIQLCCSGDTLFALMDNGTIRVLTNEVDAKWHDMPEQPGDTM